VLFGIVALLYGYIAVAAPSIPEPPVAPMATGFITGYLKSWRFQPVWPFAA
jgi:hypothetical protein